MGILAERFNQGAKIPRKRLDAFAASSHSKAATAAQHGWLTAEIGPVSMPRGDGAPLVLSADEGIRPETTRRSLASLSPAFDPNGTITAGNSSQISDGGAALVVMSRRAAEARGVQPMGEILSYSQIAGSADLLPRLPAHAISSALDMLGKSTSEVDLFEINEAFAVVGVASADELKIPEDVLNVNGGAIALGHPIGMSGTRLVITALNELRRRSGDLCAVAICGGGGQADAAVLRAVS